MAAGFLGKPIRRRGSGMLGARSKNAHGSSFMGEEPLNRLARGRGEDREIAPGSRGGGPINRLLCPPGTTPFYYGDGTYDCLQHGPSDYHAPGSCHIAFWDCLQACDDDPDASPNCGNKCRNQRDECLGG